MDHSGHPAESGNSARSNAANPAGTNVSPSTASFMAAYGSPFTSVDDMVPQGVRVPDPETTERTCTTSITARLNIPVVATSTTEGKLLLIASADPLSHLPVWVSRRPVETNMNMTTIVSADEQLFNEANGSGTTNVTSFCDPASWGQTYELIGLDDFFAQTLDLGNNSLKHRVVGCAMRANVGVNTTISRGSIEAGQFNWTDTRYRTPQYGYVPTVETSKSKSAFWMANYNPTSLSKAAEAEPELTALSKMRGLGNLLISNAYTTGERVIRSARTQDYGTLDADKGASVRWTDSSDFEFQKTYNRNLHIPDREFYPNGIVTFDNTEGYPTEDNTIIDEKGREYFAMNCNAYRANQGDNIFAGRHGGAYQAGKSANKLCYKKYMYKNAGTSSYQQGAVMLCADQSMDLEAINGSLTFSGSRTTSTDADLVQVVGSGDREALGVTDFKAFFDKGLYINIEGVSPDQWVTVELVWHIEYMPRSWSLQRGIYSPVDLQFELLAAMLGDPKQFPIVVQGHSFFSSLWRGIKRAAENVASVAGAAGTVLTSVGGQIDPRLALLGGALTTGAEAYKKLKI